MRVSKTLPPSVRSSTRYPWNKWFDGRAVFLEQGHDFVGPVRNFAAQVYTMARRWDIRVIVRVDKTRGIVALQARSAKQRGGDKS